MNAVLHRRHKMRSNNVEQSDTGFLEKLKIDVRQWQISGIITEDQATEIVEYYNYHHPLPARSNIYGRLSAILATMGAALVGVGVILLIGANWQDIPLLVKLILLWTAVIACNGLGYWLQFSRNYPRSGSAVFFLGSLVFGASIFLTTQAYHYDIDNPLLLFWWCLGILPAAYILHLSTILMLSIALLVVTFLWFLIETNGGVESATASIAITVALGTTLFAIGMFHRSSHIFYKFFWGYASYGLGILLVALYMLSFEEFLQDDFLNMVNSNPWGNFLPVIGLSFLGLSLWTLYTFQRIRRKGQGKTPILDVIAIPWAVSVSWIAYWAPQFGNPVFLAVIFNCMLAATIIAIVVAGVVERKGYLVNLGVFFFALLLVTRYVDLMWGMINGALFFISGGLLLLLIGFVLEKIRRHLTMDLLSQDDTR